VERALDPAVYNAAAKGQVRPQMPAMRVKDVREAVVASKGHQVRSEVMQRDDVANCQVCGPRDLKPSAGMHAELIH
jgi:hypothetical protein